MFFRFVTSGEVRKRSEFFEPFIMGLTNASVEQVCLKSYKLDGMLTSITFAFNALQILLKVTFTH